MLPTASCASSGLCKIFPPTTRLKRMAPLYPNRVYKIQVFRKLPSVDFKLFDNIATRLKVCGLDKHVLLFHLKSLGNVTGHFQCHTLGQAQWPCICAFSSAMRMHMQEASLVVPVKLIPRWKVIHELQQTLHNVDLCRESAIVIRRPSFIDLVR